MIVVDLEMTGLNPRRCAIVSIGAVDFENPSNRFYIECRIPDDAKVNNKAMRVHDISEASARDKSKPTAEEAVRAFIKWTESVKGDRTLAGMNPSKDRDFLVEAAWRAGVPWTFTHRTIDLFTECNSKCDEIGNSPVKEGRELDSNKIATYCGLPPEKKPHNALGGALWEAEAFSRLRTGKSLLPEFSAFKVPFYLVRRSKIAMLIRTDAQERQVSKST